MKKYILAGAIILGALALTLAMVRLAFAERGYVAFGGEYAPLIAGIVAAVMVVQRMREKENVEASD